MNMTKTQLAELNDILLERNFRKVQKNSWLLQGPNKTTIRIDLASDFIKCDWKCEKARDLTYFDHSSNVFDISNAIDSAILWTDRHLIGM